MDSFICMVAVCPVRAQPLHRSEQVSQLLFGETCILLETDNDFVRVRMSRDNYEGWCQQTQLQQINDDNGDENMRLAGEWVNQVSINNSIIHVPFGSSLSIIDKKNNADKYKISYTGNSFSPVDVSINNDAIRRFAFMFLNTPYLWGGTSVFGIDCSGFTQLVFKCLNIAILRDAYQQAAQGKNVESLSAAQCGDLAFFDNDAGKITHTGILLSKDSIIHASGKVRIDTIDNEGIINSETGRRTHRLKTIRRFIA